jgi:thiosulfate/3-mercaptopyruvate sulfurtransferase
MSSLISVEDLAGLLAADEPVVLLDIRWTLGGPSMRSVYETGHVPGAVFVDLDTELAAPPGGEHGRHPLPDTADFEAAMRHAGVGQGSRVVCYDASDATAAARAWWLLRFHGHPSDRVAVLDGGFAAWVEAGNPVDGGAVDALPGDFVAAPGRLALADAEAAASTAREGVLLDARTEIRYRGEQEPVDPVAGHVPGAVSAPTTGNVDATGHFLSADELRERFAGIVTGAGPVASYCGSGVHATHQVLALELAGIEAALYADSWSGWITDPTRPVATGAEPG